MTLFVGTCFKKQCCCPPNTYGYQCQNTCEAKDDCDGHYSCSPEGQRVCNPGWVGLPDCRIRNYNPPANCPAPCRDPICQLEPAQCSGNNTVCFRSECCCAGNYYGANCEIFCEDRDDCFGHYHCDENGDRVCNDGWVGLPQCTERYWPMAPDPDPECPAAGCPSDRQCFQQGCCCPPGLYGDNCTIVCEARDDCSGHYACNPQGQRVCVPGWAELPDCLVRDWRGEGDDPQCPDGEDCEPGTCSHQLCCCPDGNKLANV